MVRVSYRGDILLEPPRRPQVGVSPVSCPVRAVRSEDLKLPPRVKRGQTAQVTGQTKVTSCTTTPRVLVPETVTESTLFTIRIGQSIVTCCHCSPICPIPPSRN